LPQYFLQTVYQGWEDGIMFVHHSEDQVSQLYVSDLHQM